MIAKGLFSVAAAFLLYNAYKAFFGTLSRFPGPVAAKFTNLWRLMDVWGGRHQYTLRDLHKRHQSPVIRVGPNLLSLSDARWIKLIYSMKGDFKKTASYSVNDIKLPDGTIAPTTFSVRDEQLHTDMMKPIQKLYNLSNVLSYEAQIDEVLKSFVKALDTFADARIVDIGDQLVYTAYDVISNINVGASDGYLTKQTDFDGTLEISDRVWDYFARVYQMPWLDRWLAKNDLPIVSRCFPSFAQTMHRRCVEHILARIQKSGGSNHKDFLEDFVEIGGGRERANVPLLMAWLSSNVVAGSDTVALVLKAAVYYILKNPRVHERLKDEIDAANLSVPFTYRRTKELPYLDVVIKESLRIHPGVGLLMERIVPQPGVQLPDGPWLEGGTCVGMNPWVVHLDSVFGANPEAFVPERWLRESGESEAEHSARIRRMHDADLTFGGGRRVCSGRFVALVEIYKVLATLFWTFDIELVDTEKKWKVMNSWFPRQKGIEVYIRRRQNV